MSLDEGVVRIPHGITVFKLVSEGEVNDMVLYYQREIVGGNRKLHPLHLKYLSVLFMVEWQ